MERKDIENMTAPKNSIMKVGRVNHRLFQALSHRRSARARVDHSDRSIVDFAFDNIYVDNG